MPRVFDRRRTSDALLWARIGTNARGQHVVSSIPVEIKVRWLTSTAYIMDPTGNNIRVDGSAIVGQDIAEGSILWAGTIDDLVGTGTTPPTEGLLQVVGFDGTDDLKERKTFRVVKLMKHNEALPLGD